MPRPKAEDRTTLLDARAMSRALQRMAVEILEQAQGTDDLVLIGIQRRGVELAERIAKLIKSRKASMSRGCARHHALPRRSGNGRPKPVIAKPTFLAI